MSKLTFTLFYLLAKYVYSTGHKFETVFMDQMSTVPLMVLCHYWSTLSMTSLLCAQNEDISPYGFQASKLLELFCVGDWQVDIA